MCGFEKSLGEYLEKNYDKVIMKQYAMKNGLILHFLANFHYIGHKSNITAFMSTFVYFSALYQLLKKRQIPIS